MMRTIVIAAAMLMAAPPARAAEKGYEHIFDGKSIDGWRQAGPGGFVLRPDGTIESYGGLGLFWFSKKRFGDFVLKLEWKVKLPHSNSGVYVRFPDPGGDPWIGVKQGYEVQVCSRATGQIYSFKQNRGVTLKPAGQWNQMEVTAVGQKFTVKVNGKITCEMQGDGSRGLKGYIGVQNHGSKQDVVWYRNIRVKELKGESKQ